MWLLESYLTLWNLSFPIFGNQHLHFNKELSKMFFTCRASFNLSKDNYALLITLTGRKFMRTWVVETRKQYVGDQLLCQAGEGSPQQVPRAFLQDGQGRLGERVCAQLLGCVRLFAAPWTL